MVDAGALSTKFWVSEQQGSTTFRWKQDMRNTLRTYGLLIFENSDLGKQCPQLGMWLRKHYFGLPLAAKQDAARTGIASSDRPLMEEPDQDSSDPDEFDVPIGSVGRSTNGSADRHLEHLRLDKKELVHFGANFCRNTTDKRVRTCFKYMEIHALQCLNVLLASDENSSGQGHDHGSDSEPDISEYVNAVDLITTAVGSSRSVLSAFAYNPDEPVDEILCEGHVDRGLITCTTNLDGGLEVFIDGRWLRVPPTRGLVCFAGLLLERACPPRTDGSPLVRAVRHRIVSTGAKRFSVAFKLRADCFKLPLQASRNWEQSPCDRLGRIEDAIAEQLRSVNLPPRRLYKRRDAEVADTQSCDVLPNTAENIALGSAGFVQHSWHNDMPWQLKPRSLGWTDFCSEWGRKFAEWEARKFNLHFVSSEWKQELEDNRMFFARPGQVDVADKVLQTVELKWSTLVTDKVSDKFSINFTEDLFVVPDHPLRCLEQHRSKSCKKERESLCRTNSYKPYKDQHHLAGGLDNILKLFEDVVPHWGEVFALLTAQKAAVTQNVRHLVYVCEVRGD